MESDDRLALDMIVRLRDDADEIMRREGNWNDSMERHVGRAVAIVGLGKDHIQAMDPAEARKAKESPMGALAAIVGGDGRPFVWLKECVAEVLEKPELRDRITLSELVRLAGGDKDVVRCLNSIPEIEGKGKLGERVFHVDFLERCLPDEMVSNLHAHSYRLDRKTEIEREMDEQRRRLAELESELGSMEDGNEENGARG